MHQTNSTVISSGERANYDGYTRRKRRKLHLAIDTLGAPVVLQAKPANEQERAQLSESCEQIQAVPDRSVELAYVDQGYTGDDAAEAAAEHGTHLSVVNLPEAR